MSSRTKTLVYGEILVDVFAESVERPGPGFRTFHFRGVPGGAPVNVAINLASYGYPVSFISSFADDPTGAELRQMVEEWGVETAYSVVHEYSRTPLAMVLNTPDGDRTFRLYLDNSAVEQLEPEMIDEQAFTGCGWFHYEGVLLPFANPQKVTFYLLEAARSRGMVTSFDVNVRPDVWMKSQIDRQVILDACRQADIIKLSDDDFAWLRENVDAGLQSPADLLELGCQVVAWTRGKEGATLVTGRHRVDVPAPEVKVVETTGAGDAFMAGIIAAFQDSGVDSKAALDRGITEKQLQAAGEFAATCAARVLTQKGALPGS